MKKPLQNLALISRIYLRRDLSNNKKMTKTKLNIIAEIKLLMEPILLPAARL